MHLHYKQMQSHESSESIATAMPEGRALNIEELIELRAQIDAIDERIVTLLAARFSITDQVGKLKAVSGLDAVDSQRESRQVEKYNCLANSNGLSPTVVNQVFRVIIAEVVSSHHRAAAAHQE